MANRPRDRNSFGLAVFALAFAVGVGVASSTSLPVGAALLTAPTLVAFGFLVAQGPKWCLLGLIAAVVFGYSHDSVTLGSVDLRVPDLFLVARGLGRGAPSPQRATWLDPRPASARAVARGFGVVALPAARPRHGGCGHARRLAPPRGDVRARLARPLHALPARDIEFLLGGIALITTTEIFLAVVSALAEGTVGTRLSGANDANSTGLLAAIVVVLALHGPVPVRRPLRLFMLATGVVGLLMSRSLGSTAAAVVALGIFGVRIVSARSRRRATAISSFRLG